MWTFQEVTVNLEPLYIQATNIFFGLSIEIVVNDLDEHLDL
jgi:hypothetical protein